jgi:tRNA (adenine57-N1/adenine58-N1)-methyltransferase
MIGSLLQILGCLLSLKVPISRHRFKEGDLVLLIDRKDRRYLITLDSTGSFHSHTGLLPHTAIIGEEYGARLSTSQGQSLLALVPTLADYVTHLPRASQVIYPKDLGAILMAADIFPGARVLEAGLGSGALTTTLLRAVGVSGSVFSYEIRDSIVKRATRNIERVSPNLNNLTIHVADVYEQIIEKELDRVILDLPEPWRLVSAVAAAMVPGGILLGFLPTTLQVHQFSEALREHPRFDLIETMEVMIRPWHVAPWSVRPAHRMVAHTGFIVTARICGYKEPVSPRPKDPINGANEPEESQHEGL